MVFLYGQADLPSGNTFTVTFDIQPPSSSGKSNGVADLKRRLTDAERRLSAIEDGATTTNSTVADMSDRVGTLETNNQHIDEFRMMLKKIDNNTTPVVDISE